MSSSWVCASRFGRMRLTEKEGRVVSVGFDSGTTGRRNPHAVLRRLKKELDEYFDGKRKKFTVPFLLQGTTFEKKVWKTLGRVPYGRTVSYARLAEMIGSPRSARAVGQAVGKNRHALIVPCHRVIRQDGKFGGYRWGIYRKSRLMGHESHSRGKNHFPMPMLYRLRGVVRPRMFAKTTSVFYP